MGQKRPRFICNSNIFYNQMTLFIWETQYYISFPKENINSTFLKKRLLNVQLVTTISFNIIKYMWKIPWSKPSAKQILLQSGSEGVYVYEGNAISLFFTHPLTVGHAAELTVVMCLLYAWHQLLEVKKLLLFLGEHLCLVKKTSKSHFSILNSSTHWNFNPGSQKYFADND